MKERMPQVGIFSDFNSGILCHHHYEPTYAAVTRVTFIAMPSGKFRWMYSRNVFAVEPVTCLNWKKTSRSCHSRHKPLFTDTINIRTSMSSFWWPFSQWSWARQLHFPVNIVLIYVSFPNNSKFFTSAHVFLEHLFCLTPSTSIIVQCLIQSTSSLYSRCPNHLNLSLICL